MSETTPDNTEPEAEGGEESSLRRRAYDAINVIRDLMIEEKTDSIAFSGDLGVPGMSMAIRATAFVVRTPAMPAEIRVDDLDKVRVLLEALNTAIGNPEPTATEAAIAYRKIERVLRNHDVPSLLVRLDAAAREMDDFR